MFKVKNQKQLVTGNLKYIASQCQSLESVFRLLFSAQPPSVIPRWNPQCLHNALEILKV